MSQKQNGEKTSPPAPPPVIVGGINLSELRPAELVEMGSKGGIFQCPLCQKTFGYKNGLMRHIRLTHVGEKPYQCNICQRRFGYKHILMEHQNLHFGNRPYACNMCDKKFAARSNLIQHRLVHKKPFNCNLCSKRFDREDQLKKHLFAHPQSLLTCNVCQYAAASQSDLNRHMVEKHHPQVLETRPPVRRSSTETPPPDGQSEHSIEPITPPSSSPASSTAYSGTSPANQQSPVAARPLQRIDDISSHFTVPTIAGQQSPIAARPIQRIDDIASHLSAAAARAGPILAPGGIFIKQEVDDSQSEPNTCQETARQSVSSTEGVVENLSTTDQGHSESRRSVDEAIHSEHRRSLDEVPGHQTPHYDPEIHRRQVETPRQAWPAPGFPPPAGCVSMPNVAPFSCTIETPGHEIAQGAALPAIHELFSRRSQRVMPTFTSFPPPMLGGALPPQEVPNPMLSPPACTIPNSLPSPSAPPPTTRPTAQLPPITHVLRHTKEIGIQHAAPLPGIPDLEDVISYYQSQGKLFRCQYCNIVFFERGMFFLHASLHGPSNPWECSICHKVCQDKNEFTLHFVNQQHMTA